MQDVSFVASENIPVSVFVKRTAGTDFQMSVCGAGDHADIGVSHQGSQDTALPGTATPLIAAYAGSSCKTYGPGKTCEIYAGATIAAGDKLKPDASGHAIPAVATNTYSAIANADAVDGEKVSVTIQTGVAT
jgi:hypothetical protein